MVEQKNLRVVFSKEADLAFDSIIETEKILQELE